MARTPAFTLLLLALRAMATSAFVAVDPSTANGSSNSSNQDQRPLKEETTSRISATLVLIPLGIFASILLTVIFVRLSWRWSGFCRGNKVIVTRTKPVQIAYEGEGGEGEMHEVINVDDDAASTRSGNAGTVRGREHYFHDQHTLRTMRSTESTRPLTTTAIVYTDMPPGYLVNE
ncbi:hypothetical protein DFS34DRAFT_597653 [Phlyctochytrium arcticum]|nr:hypothetical protein DFS34DRAFT_597653 [Phlyctochytrium arcticum]